MAVKRRNGFTLIELLLVFGLLAVLLALAAPTVFQFIEKNRINGAAAVLLQTIHFARTEAIKRNQAVRLVVQTPGTQWCYGLTEAATCNCHLPGNCTLGHVDASAFKRVTLSTGVTFPADGLVFEPVGHSFNASGTLALAIGNYAIDLRFSRLGQLRLCSNTVGGYPPC